MVSQYLPATYLLIQRSNSNLIVKKPVSNPLNELIHVHGIKQSCGPPERALWAKQSITSTPLLQEMRELNVITREHQTRTQTEGILKITDWYVSRSRKDGRLQVRTKVTGWPTAASRPELDPPPRAAVQPQAGRASGEDEATGRWWNPVGQTEGRRGENPPVAEKPVYEYRWNPLPGGKSGNTWGGTTQGTGVIPE